MVAKWFSNCSIPTIFSRWYSAPTVSKNPPFLSVSPSLTQLSSYLHIYPSVICQTVYPSIYRSINLSNHLIYLIIYHLSSNTLMDFQFSMVCNSFVFIILVLRLFQIWMQQFLGLCEPLSFWGNISLLSTLARYSGIIIYLPSHRMH